MTTIIILLAGAVFGLWGASRRATHIIERFFGGRDD